MTELSLRLDLADNSDARRPWWPMSFSVLGFTCGTDAVVQRDDVKATRWRVLITPPGEKAETWPMHFANPDEALEALTSWVRRRSGELRVERRA